MNKELMCDLALKAGYLPDGFGFGHWDMEECRKFAELIVKETISEMIQQMWNYGIDESNNPSFYKAIDATKKTFGVE